MVRFSHGFMKNLTVFLYFPKGTGGKLSEKCFNSCQILTNLVSNSYKSVMLNG